jgi:hypothetical protein
MKVRWHDFHELPEIVEHANLYTLVKKISSWDCFILVTSPPPCFVLHRRWMYFCGNPPLKQITIVTEYVKLTPHWQLYERGHKRSFCQVIWLDFVCVHGSSYIFLYMKMSPGLSRHHLAEGARFSKLPVRCQFYVLRHEKGIGRECNVIVCVLGSDLMWLQHILMSNSWTSRCPSCDQPLLPCWKVWPWRFWLAFGRGGWGIGIFFFMLWLVVMVVWWDRRNWWDGSDHKMFSQGTIRTWTRVPF